MKTAPDPPEAPTEGIVPFLHRHSTCSQDPPEMCGDRGIDPTECNIKIKDSSIKSKSSVSVTSHKPRSRVNDQKSPATSQHSVPEYHYSNLKTSETLHQSRLISDGQKSPASLLSQHSVLDGAMVLYEPPTHSSLVGEEKDESLVGNLTSEPRGMEVRTNNRQITKPPPTEYASEDMRRGFDHCFVTVPCKERLSVLFATLRRSSERKVIVICSTWESAAFHALLFRQLEMLHVYEMHESMKDRDVAFAYDEFLYLYPGILFSSEIAMREFDVPPNVDYLIQYEPPMNPTEYIYRMSNAKVYRTSCCQALLFLTSDEMLFLESFDNIENRELEARRVSDFQKSVEKLVTKHRELNKLAWRAFKAFLLAYKGHPYGDVYDYSKIDEDGTRRSFGQPHSPERWSKHSVHKTGTSGENGDATKEETEDEKSAGQHLEHRHWSAKEKTWRKGGKPWASRGDKTWKHAKMHL